MPPGETPEQPEGQPPARPPAPPDSFSAQPGRWPRQAPRPLQRPNYGGRIPVTPPRPPAPVPPTNAPVPSVPQAEVPQQPLPPVPAATPDFTPTPRPAFALPESATTPANPLPVKESKRRLIKAAAIILIVLLLAGAAFAVWKWQKSRTDPDTAFKDAMQTSLSTTKLQSNTSTDTASNQVKYDFSSPKNPLVSSQAKLQIADSEFGLSGYGSIANTYISYTNLPPSVSQPLATAVRDGWVQLRANRIQQPGIPYKLTNLADPRYQAFGPIIFGNFDDHTRSQLLSFEQAHNVYSYNPKSVTHTTVNGVKVLAYSVRLNTGFLKILNQSAANSEGLTPNDVQNAVGELDNYINTKSMLYISIAHHQLVRAEFPLAGGTKTVDYNHDDTLSLPAEPQTKLTWQNFMNFQYQIESQAASRQTVASIDAARKAQLIQIQAKLKAYYATNQAYPTLNQMNDQSWVEANLPDLDSDNFRDPLGLSPHLAAAPKAGVIAYQPHGTNPKTACDGSPLNPCNQYTLTAILSDSVHYEIQQP